MKSVIITVLALLPGALAQSVQPSQLLHGAAITGEAVVYDGSRGRWTHGLEGQTPPCVLTAAVGAFICTHNLNSLAVKVWVWDSSGNLVRLPVSKPTVNTVSIYCDSSFTGIAAIK